MSFGRDLTQGSIPRHLLAVAVPMLLNNFINTGYSLINTIWLGKIIGKDAVAASAASWPIVFLFIALASGVTMATTILVSQYYGAKRLDQVKKVVGNSFSIALLLGTVLSVAGILTADILLKVMRTPAEIVTMAAQYLKISYLGFVIMYFSFLITSILRGIGDTRTPLIFSVAGVAMNALLDPLLIIGVGPLPRLGLNGAAIASVIAGAFALVLGLRYLNRKDSFVAFRFRNLSFDQWMIGMIFKIGLPATIQQSLVSIGSAAVTSVVNTFGTAAVAAFGACGRIDSVAFMPAMSIGMSVSTLAGQNLGAGNSDRVKQTFKWGFLMSIAIAGFFSILFVTIPGILVSIFVKEPEVIAIGSIYLRIVGPSSIMFAIMFVSNGVINGAGHTITTMIFTLVSLWVVRVPLAIVLSKTLLGLTGVWISFATSFLIMMTISLVYYRTGRWKKIVARPAPKPAVEPVEPLPEVSP